jgi:hypothetical protein
MSLEGIIIAFLLSAAVLFWIALPLVSRHSGGGAEALAQKQRERLLVYYARVITNIRDLDEDHSTGKIADDDYQHERETWMQRGIQVLKALDSLEVGEQALLHPTSTDEAAIDDAIETAISRYRAK